MIFPWVVNTTSSANASASTNHTVSLPSGIQAEDIIVVFFEIDGNVASGNAPSGWWKLDQLTGGSSTVGTCYLKVATGSEGSTQVFTTASSDETAHVAFLIRGADPNTIEYGAASYSTSSNPTAPAVTAKGWGTEGMLWITSLGTQGADNITSFPTNFTNNQVRQVCGANVCFQSAASYSASGSSVTPGNWALTVLNHCRCFTIGFRPVPHTPRVGYVNQGSIDSSTTGPVTPSIPVGIKDNDIGLCFIEGAVAVSPVTGWAHVGNSPSTSGGTTLSVWWKRLLASEAGSTITLPVTTDHRVARIAAFRGCKTNGNPWEASTGSTEGSDTSVSITGGTTVSNNTLVVSISSHGTDTGSAEFSAWANADLVAIDQILNDSTTQGNGGGYGAAVGGKEWIGSYGATTATLVTSSEKGMISLVLAPQPVPPKISIRIGND